MYCLIEHEITATFSDGTYRELLAADMDGRMDRMRPMKRNKLGQ